MINSKLVDKAKKIAHDAHEGQQRKYNHLPYIVHPERVAKRVDDILTDNFMVFPVHEICVAAAYLHDVPEDCANTWRDYIANECGAEVFILVHELTNPSKGLTGSRDLRKLIDRTHLRSVTKEAKMIKLIDRTDNLNEMVGADTDFKKKYAKESKALLNALFPNPEYDLDALPFYFSFLYSDCQNAIFNLEKSAK